MTGHAAMMAWQLAWHLAWHLASNAVGVPVAGAGGEPPPLSLQWEAPSSCPARAHVDQEIRRYLGGASAPLGNQVVVAAVVRREGTEYRLVLTVRTDAGEARTDLVSPDCVVLADAAALKVAMAVDPMAVVSGLHSVAQAPAQGVPPAGPPAPRAEHRATAPLVQARVPTPSRKVSYYAIHGGAAVSAGDLPGTGFGARLGVALQRGLWRLQWTASLWPRRTVRLADGRGGAISLADALLASCVVPRVGARVALPLCAGLELGAMSSVGRGLEDPQRITQLWAAAVAQTGVSVDVLPQRLALRVGVQAVLPLRRLGFRVSVTEEVFRVSRAVVRSFFGLEVRLGHKDPAVRR